ncbi:MAG: aminotransferase [Gammaproteobacteria bacterium]|nr:MAG: aminotransferase [Gammaproteobacteria bacterium]
MTINFDRLIQREQTASLKHDGRKGYFGKDDVIPLWVADMDFAAPEAVTQALIARAEHPVYGYTMYPDSMFEAMQSWFQQRHNWQIDRRSIVMCPGVVPSLYAVIQGLTKPGDKVIIQPPVYHPFFTTITKSERELVLNPLQLKDGLYRMDLEHFEQCAAEGAKLLLFCSPHNPAGRVWQQEELESLLAIAAKYNVTIVSDEIHADLIYPHEQHIPLAAIAGDVSVVSTVSPSKSFNIPGLGLSAMVINDPEQRRLINGVFESWHISAANPFSISAFEAAYRSGADWLEQLMIYLDETRNQVVDFIKNNVPSIKVMPSQGTYLLWIDCQELGLADDELRLFFINEAKVGMNPGVTFGEVGSGFMRMNIAAPRQVIMEACQRIADACNQL